MNQEPIHIGSDTFRSRLIPAAAAVYALSALLGLPGCVYLLNSDFRELMRYEQFLRGYLETRVINTWMLIYSILGVTCTVCATIMAWGLVCILSAKRMKGFSLLGGTARVLLYFLRGIGILALISFVVQMVSSIAFYLKYNDGFAFIFTTVLIEGAMGVLAWYVYRKLCEFLSCAEDCSVSIAYTLSSGQLDSKIFPAFAATGFLLLSIVCFLLTIDRTFYLTIVNAFPKDYFQLMVIRHPVQWMTSASYLLGGIGNLLIYLYLRNFLRIHERLKFEARKRIRV